MPIPFYVVAAVLWLATVAFINQPRAEADPAGPASISPHVIGKIPLPGVPVDMALTDSLLYVACAASLQIVDIRDPLHPQVLGATTPEQISNVYGVAVTGHYAYVTALQNGLYVVDVSNPAAPEVVGHMAGEAPMDEIEIYGDLAYITTYDAYILLVVDISDRPMPRRLGYSFMYGQGGALALRGSTAYVAHSHSFDYKLAIVDAQNPQSPATSTLPLPSLARGLAWKDDNLLVLTGGHGLRIYDCVAPSLPILVGTAPFTGQFNDTLGHAIAVEGDHALLCLERSRLSNPYNAIAVVDIAEPANPIELGEVRLEQQVNDIQSSRGYTYVACDGGEVAILDCTMLFGDDCFDPDVVDTPDDQGGSVTVSWNRLSADSLGAATPVTSYRVQRRAGTWQTIGEVPANVAERYSVVVPTPDVLAVGQQPTHSSFRVLAVTNDPNTQYESLHVDGFSVDNLPPAAPELALYDTEVSRVLAWTADAADDLRETCLYRDFTPAFDAGDPVTCSSTLNFYLENHLARYYYRARSFDIHGNASEWSNEVTGRWPTPVPGATATALRLYPCRPNPFNPRTTIEFDLPVSGHVRLSVFDVAGNHIRTLVDENLSLGNHASAWDGRDASGRAVGSGGYLARLEFGGQVQTIRLGLVR